MLMCYVDESGEDGHKLGGVSVLAGGNNKVSPVQVFGAKSP